MYGRACHGIGCRFSLDFARAGVVVSFGQAFPEDQRKTKPLHYLFPCYHVTIIVLLHRTRPVTFSLFSLAEKIFFFWGTELFALLLLSALAWPFSAIAAVGGSSHRRCGCFIFLEFVLAISWL
jgi:hypothetical protein